MEKKDVEKRIDRILMCFHKMDLYGLIKELKYNDDFLLSTEKNFTQLLSSLFNQLKARGETYLHVLPGTGKDEYDYEKNAFQFIGNNNQNYFEMIIDTNLNFDFPNVNFIECLEIETDLFSMQLGNHFIISVDEYKKLEISQEEELLDELKKGKEAVDELQPFIRHVNSLSIYLDWIKKYTPLFEKHFTFESENNSEFYSFFRVFLTLRKLKFLSNEELITYARMGYKEFQNLDNTKSIDILTWLCRYEKIMTWMIPYSDLSVEMNIKRGYFEFEDCKIHLGELDEVLKFIHYYRYYDKYFSHKFYEMELEYDVGFTDYYSAQAMGFYERNLKRTGISIEPFKIHMEEEPIEQLFLQKEHPESQIKMVKPSKSISWLSNKIKNDTINPLN